MRSATREAGQPTPGADRTGTSLGLARAAALVAAAVGAVASLGLTLQAGRSTPRFLLVLFVVWILSPFMALALAIVVSTRWSALTRATLYCVTLLVALGSPAAYGDVVPPPAGSPRGFWFVIAPAASWLLAAIAIPLAASIARRRSRGKVTATDSR